MRSDSIDELLKLEARLLDSSSSGGGRKRALESDKMAVETKLIATGRPDRGDGFPDRAGHAARGSPPSPARRA